MCMRNLPLGGTLSLIANFEQSWKVEFQKCTSSTPITVWLNINKGYPFLSEIVHQFLFKCGS
jgi:hypothetical protein